MRTKFNVVRHPLWYKRTGFITPEPQSKPLPQAFAQAVAPDEYRGVISSRGRGYRQDNIRPYSHYRRELIQREEGEPKGYSRVYGDVNTADQLVLMDRAFAAMDQHSDLTEADKTLILAIMKHESGFNPDAAAGTTSAAGLGQFIDARWRELGGTDKNRWDIDTQIEIMIMHYKELKAKARAKGQGVHAIYRRHHDGQNSDNPNGLGQRIYNRHIRPGLNVWADLVEAFMLRKEEAERIAGQSLSHDSARPG